MSAYKHLKLIEYHLLKMIFSFLNDAKLLLFSVKNPQFYFFPEKSTHRKILSIVISFNYDGKNICTWSGKQLDNY